MANRSTGSAEEALSTRQKNKEENTKNNGNTQKYLTWTEQQWGIPQFMECLPSGD